jgi:SAM-dependent methyltransferase
VSADAGSPACDPEPVREAYSALAAQYVDHAAGDWSPDSAETAFVERHLTGLSGGVLDLGCGPGHWTAHLHARGADVTGVDLVPELVAHARSTYPGPTFRLGSMTEVDVAARPVAGVLSWYSTIHVAPPQLDAVLAGFHRLLAPSGVLVLGFFDSEDVVAAFDHAVVTAYRWPVDAMAGHLARAGFTEVERLQQRSPDRRTAGTPSWPRTRTDAARAPRGL